MLSGQLPDVIVKTRKYGTLNLSKKNGNPAELADRH
jgi:hypothetical protein